MKLTMGGGAASSFAAVLAGAVAAFPALAQEQEDNFVLSGAAELRAVENATNLPKEADQVNEIQSRASLQATGVLENSWSLLQADAELTDRRYSEQEDRNERLFLGELLYRLGSEASRGRLELMHSGEEVTIDPDAGDIPANRDSRQISAAAGYFSPVLTRLTDVALWVSASTVRFDVFTQNDSRRLAGGLNITRRVSPIWTAGLLSSSTRVEYVEDGRLSDFYRAALLAHGELRTRTYHLELGLDYFESEGRDDDSLYLSFEADWQSGGSGLTISADQWLSDTSMGDENATGLDGLVGQDGTLRVIDQFVNRDAVIRWQSARLCQRCKLSLSAVFHQEEYQVFTEYDTEEVRFRVDGAYDLTLRWALFGSLAASDVGFDSEDSPFRDYRDWQVRAGGSVRLSERGQMEFFAAATDRVFPDERSRDYVTSYIGASFSYRIYNR